MKEPADMSGISARFNVAWPHFELSVEVDLPGNGVIALFGQSGSGKTTLLRCVAGLERHAVGSLTVNGSVWQSESMRLPTHRRPLGYVFQEASLFDHLSVVGNLEFGLRRARSPRAALDHAIELLDIGHLLERKPQQLSGGERQRVAIARALAVNPQILLMDEPLAALDSKLKQEILPYLERLRDELKIPILYVSHQFEEVLQLATYVVLMRNGRVLSHGTLPHVSLQPEMRELVGAEAMGTVVEGRVQRVDLATGLAQVSVGQGLLNVDAATLIAGQTARMQLLARDLILALQQPHGLSVRNMLQGVITRIEPDEPHAVLVHVDIGGTELIARVTTVATHELKLRAGLSLWVLVKAVTLRGHVFAAR